MIACQKIPHLTPLLMEAVSFRFRDSEDSCSESFNGAVCEGYSWSQTISDVDVAVRVPASVARASNVSVEVTAQGLSVSLAGSTEPLVHGDFSWRTKKEDAVWSLVPGTLVQVSNLICLDISGILYQR